MNSSKFYTIIMLLSLTGVSTQCASSADKLAISIPIPVVIMDKNELAAQIAEMQKFNPKDMAAATVPGFITGLVYEHYVSHCSKGRGDQFGNIAETLSAVICSSMAKQLLFTYLYGNSEKGKAVNTVDTLVTFMTFLAARKK